MSVERVIDLLAVLYVPVAAVAALERKFSQGNRSVLPYVTHNLSAG
jgi:hypothetical protein